MATRRIPPVASTRDIGALGTFAVFDTATVPPPADPAPVELPDDRLAGGGFSGALPALLLPVRIETRWMPAAPGLELWVRLFPDAIHVTSERSGLDAGEATLAQRFITAQSDDVGRAAWDELVRVRGAARAAHVVLQVRAGAPAVEVSADESDTRAHLLPTRFVLVLEGAGVARVAWGRDLPAIVPAGVADPDDEATRWQFEFSAAEALGLALRVPFDLAQAGALKRIVAIGLRDGAPEAQAAALGEHLARQFGSAGAALLEVGTPTNNSDDAPSGFDSASRADAQSAALRRLDEPLAADAEGARLALALGLPEAPMRAWVGARLRSDADVASMHNALWPATLGTWLSRLLTPAVPVAAQAFMRELFVADVRARGVLPTLRIGRQPYGVLPATSLNRWQPGSDGTAAAARVLRQLREHWAGQAHPPTLHGGGDETTLRAALTQLPGSRRLGLRRLRQSPLRGGPARLESDRRWAAVAPVLQRLGLSLRPEMSSWFHDPQAHWTSLPAVAPRGADRHQPLGANYLQALATAADAATVRGHRVPGAAPASLLYLLLRAGLLEQALTMVEQVFGVTSVNVRDHRSGVTVERVERAWRFLDSASPRLGGATISQLMARPVQRREMVVALEEWVRLVAPIRRQRAAMGRLAALPVATLERLLHETLDVCAYRLDAWVGALASRRLREQRVAAPAGVHVGAWGWVGAPPLPAHPGAPARSEGYELAPSLTHARTAALLRSGYTHHRRDDPAAEGLALDLASARVRSALELLRLARAGQGVGELLGRRLERWLVEHDLGAQTPALRMQAPLGGGRIGIDGVALDVLWDREPPPPALADAAAQLDEWIDGLADLMLAEGLHQTVAGRRERARAALDAIERGETLPTEIDVAAGPRSAASTGWCLALVVPGDGPAWPGSADGVRAQTAPQIETLAASLLGKPATLVWTVTGASKKGVIRRLKLKPTDLGLSALDTTLLARRAEALAGLVRSAAAAKGLVRVDSIEESPALRAALLVARLFARLLDAAMPAPADARAAADRLESALAALRDDSPAMRRRRAAWSGGDAAVAVIDERLAAAPAEAAARVESLTGLRCTAALPAELPPPLPDTSAALGAASPSAWLHDLGRLRPAVAALASITLARPAWFAGRWSVHDDADGTRTLVVGATAGAGGSADTGTRHALLVLDRWTEAQPADGLTAALSLQVDAPRARAPQSLLLAVSPAPAQPWSLSALHAVVAETIDLLPLRLVSPDAVAGQYLPGLYIADDLDGEALGVVAASAIRRVVR